MCVSGGQKARGGSLVVSKWTDKMSKDKAICIEALYKHTYLLKYARCVHLRAVLYAYTDVLFPSETINNKLRTSSSKQLQIVAPSAEGIREVLLSANRVAIRAVLNKACLEP